MAWLGRAIPTGVVLGLLIGLAYWGHQTEWTFVAPGTTPRGEGDPAGKDVLVQIRVGPPPPAHGFCQTHGVLDCPLDHPEVAQAKAPAFTPAYLERVKQTLALRPRPGLVVADSRPPRRLQFTSAEDVAKAGIDVAPVLPSAIVETLSVNGELAFDPTRTARLAPRVAGAAFLVAKKVGDPVRAEDVLALVDAAEVGKAKAEIQQALVQHKLRGKVVENLRSAGKDIPERQRREAEAGLREAQVRLVAAEQALSNLGLTIRAAEYLPLEMEEVARRLQFLGLPETLTKNLDPKATGSNLIPITAPFDGAVYSCDVVTGEVVAPGKVLFVVLDNRQLWLNLNVRLEDARLVKVGQAVRFRPDGQPEEAQGQVNWVSPAGDEKTRTIQVRAALDNAAGTLRASTFGVGRIVLREEPEALTIPTEAIQEDGPVRLVFVRDKDYFLKDGPKAFHVRTVRTGVQEGPNTEIIAGLAPGEVVAAKGAAWLLNELRKNAGAAGRGAP
jgi:cobalt-zinc-cadmium efflux system membrane fusion protein